MKFDVKKRWSGKVLFTAEIDCDEGASASIKMGFAVKWAIKNKANLSGADLSGADLSRADLSGADLSGADLTGANLSGADLSRADLSGANLSGADLSRANLFGANLTGADLFEANLFRANLFGADLLDGGQRSDGYRFVGWIKDGELWIRAGCRNFNIHDARKHWHETRPNTPLGDESQAILDCIEARAKIRGLIKAAGRED